MLLEPGGFITPHKDTDEHKLITNKHGIKPSKRLFNENGRS